MRDPDCTVKRDANVSAVRSSISSYSNADYDIRNNLVGDAVYEEPFKVQSRIVNPLVSGWMIAGKTYFRSGEPFSVVNSNVVAGFPTLATIPGTTLMPQVSGFQLTNTCGAILMRRSMLRAWIRRNTKERIKARLVICAGIRFTVRTMQHGCDTDEANCQSRGSDSHAGCASV